MFHLICIIYEIKWHRVEINSVKKLTNIYIIKDLNENHLEHIRDESIKSKILDLIEIEYIAYGLN
jgi:hypothetical protein